MGCEDLDVVPGLEEGCNLVTAPGEAAVDAVQTASGAVETAAGVGSWATDPFGNLAELARNATNGLATEVLPWFVDALEPNLSAGWFIDMYAATFGLAVGVWVLILMWGLVAYARGKQGPAETWDMLLTRSAVFIIGAMFGPAVGTFLIGVVGALTKGVLRVFVAEGASTDEVVLYIGDLTTGGGGVEAFIGGSLVAVLVYGAMLLGLLGVILTLLVMLVACYFAGVVFPLGWVWVTREKTSKKGLKIVWVFVGILLAHPLLFMMLGVSMELATSSIFGSTVDKPGSEEAPDALRALIGLVLATIALWMTAMSPAMLGKFAPILPTEGDIGGVGAGDLKNPFGGSSGESGSGLGNMSQAGTGPGSGGGDFGGQSILNSQAAGGPNTSSGESTEAGDGIGTAAAEGAATGAEEGAEAGAETGPGAAVTAGVGAAAGATAATITEGGKEATEEAGHLADASSGGEDTEPGDSTESDGSGGGALSSASRKKDPSKGGGLGDVMSNLSDMAAEQMDDYGDPDRLR